MVPACLTIEKNCRVLTVRGSADETVPAKDASEFAKLIPNHKLHIIDGANHDYTFHQAELASLVLGFIKSGLQKENDMFNHVQSCSRDEKPRNARL
ncbi:hypothetical protein GIB67_043296 [Kingdonia uniflora]|uniref:Uncharacterized protein n=1 Tax=Kingdonia uniflora TaxID=39325 RepID=A0A7J7NQY4_9MAGN|nr:hypothetical protein GIB67_043296 [Kingdonia uniflora]